jgi:hypothetical protein
MNKDFFKKWKQGIMEIDMLQQITIQIRSTWITIIGLFAGIIICLFGFQNLWWLFLILLGGLGNTSVQIIALYQKKKNLTKIEDYFYPEVYLEREGELFEEIYEEKENKKKENKKFPYKRRKNG